MDFYTASVGLLLAIFGALILAVLYKEGDFDKGAEITRSTVGLLFAGIFGVVGGIYFIIISL